MGSLANNYYLCLSNEIFVDRDIQYFVGWSLKGPSSGMDHRHFGPILYHKTLLSDHELRLISHNIQLLGLYFFLIIHFLTNFQHYNFPLLLFTYCYSFAHFLFIRKLCTLIFIVFMRIFNVISRDQVSFVSNIP